MSLTIWYKIILVNLDNDSEQIPLNSYWDTVSQAKHDAEIYATFIQLTNYDIFVVPTSYNPFQ